MSKINDILNSNLNEYVNFSDLDQAVSKLNTLLLTQVSKNNHTYKQTLTSHRSSDESFTFVSIK